MRHSPVKARQDLARAREAKIPFTPQIKCDYNLSMRNLLSKAVPPLLTVYKCNMQNKKVTHLKNCFSAYIRYYFQCGFLESFRNTRLAVSEFYTTTRN